jgi:hypothetical protein
MVKTESFHSLVGNLPSVKALGTGGYIQLKMVAECNNQQWTDNSSMKLPFS